MFIKEEKLIKQHKRHSKNGKEHFYLRTVTLVTLRCDNCHKLFVREKGRISSKRCTNKYYHCCTECDTKRFAQRKGSEKRAIWNLPVSSTISIDKL